MQWRGQSLVKPFCSHLCNQMASHQLTVLHSAVLPNTQSLADLSTSWSPSTLNHTVMLYRAALSSTTRHSVTGWPFHKLHSTTLSACTMPHSAVSLSHQLTFSQTDLHSTTLSSCTMPHSAVWLSHWLTFSETDLHSTTLSSCPMPQSAVSLSHRLTFSQTDLHSTTLSSCTMLHSAVSSDTQSPADLSTNWSCSTLNHIRMLYSGQFVCI